MLIWCQKHSKGDHLEVCRIYAKREGPGEGGGVSHLLKRVLYWVSRKVMFFHVSLEARLSLSSGNVYFFIGFFWMYACLWNEFFLCVQLGTTVSHAAVDQSKGMYTVCLELATRVASS